HRRRRLPPRRAAHRHALQARAGLAGDPGGPAGRGGRRRGGGAVIPSAFTYHRPETLDEVFELLGRYGDQAKLLAGGHSLLPAMKLRLAQIQVLIDLARVKELRGVSVEPGGALRLGALTTHHQVM